MDSEQTQRDQKRDQALTVIANAFTSIAHSLAVIAANTTGISPEEKAAIKKVTADLSSSHNRLQDAVTAASAGVKQSSKQ